ncbi:hypothetical protein [Paraliobacillus sediminis]|uniref:hypothetical protein n=1 Tax=Paraliobacillus sediminis TaxID=1885916 RepID=UPI000E3E9F13|nr:hypothetical protein [Paraliobacillus sediminis]
MKNGLHIIELYTKMPNNEEEERYYLKENIVQNILLGLEVVELKNNKKLVITELGKKILKKNKEGFTIPFRDNELKNGNKGKSELKGITNCLKCNQPLNNIRNSYTLLCFSCRRQEAIAEIESD